jgi:epoxide hydrolase-like predicted phosphatase
VLRAVISDWGGVLTSPLLGSFNRFQQQADIPLETLGVAMQRLTEANGENPLFPMERGEISEAEFLAALGTEVEAHLGRAVPMETFAADFFSTLETNAPMVDWLVGAKDRGVRVALLTNNVREWEPRWRAMLPDDLFEVVVDSSRVGLRKPDPRIYELVLERLGLPGGACAFVDDLEPNCVAAAEAGMHAVWFQDSEQAIAELEGLVQLSQPSRSHR